MWLLELWILELLFNHSFKNKKKKKKLTPIYVVVYMTQMDNISGWTFYNRSNFNFNN